MTASGTITVNGRRRVVVPGSVQDLLRSLGHDPDRAGIAVAVNEEVVPRRQWAEREIRPGDRIEIVGAVQGG